MRHHRRPPPRERDHLPPRGTPPLCRCDLASDEGERALGILNANASEGGEAGEAGREGEENVEEDRQASEYERRLKGVSCILKGKGRTAADGSESRFPRGWGSVSCTVRSILADAPPLLADGAADDGAAEEAREVPLLPFNALEMRKSLTRRASSSSSGGSFHASSPASSSPASMSSSSISCNSSCNSRAAATASLNMSSSSISCASFTACSSLEAPQSIGDSDGHLQLSHPHEGSNSKLQQQLQQQGRECLLGELENMFCSRANRTPDQEERYSELLLTLDLEDIEKLVKKVEGESCICQDVDVGDGKGAAASAMACITSCNLDVSDGNEARMNAEEVLADGAAGRGRQARAAAGADDRGAYRGVDIATPLGQSPAATSPEEGGRRMEEGSGCNTGNERFTLLSPSPTADQLVCCSPTGGNRAPSPTGGEHSASCFRHWTWRRK